MTKNLTFVQEEAKNFDVNENSVIHKYILTKTKAAQRDSKSRRSLGTLYALYVLCHDYLNGNEKGSTFTELLNRMKDMPFGAKLQNHPLDNRMNDEVRRKFTLREDMLPVQPADLGDGKKARKISIALLSENGMNPKKTAAYVVASIQKYIEIIDDNQTTYLHEIEAANTVDAIVSLIKKAFEYKADARLFEIVSFGLLHIHFLKTKITWTLNGITKTESLSLYRTGRTNANDGGIDFVLIPLGKFFQVTESLDFKKYFLDFDKVNRFPLSFVIKTDLSSVQVREQIQNSAKKKLSPALVKKYIELFDEIYTLNELNDILNYIKTSPELVSQLKEIIINSFKLEYGLLD
jgi:hypothetical protein